MINNTLAGGILLLILGLMVAGGTLYCIYMSLKLVSSARLYWNSLSKPIDALEYCSMGYGVLAQIFKVAFMFTLTHASIMKGLKDIQILI